jgi:hypothetical protein
MLTNAKRFNAIATPILYMEIITDNLPLLMRGMLQNKGVFPPSAARKLRLLALCRHLHLEPQRTLIRGSKGPDTFEPENSRSVRRTFAQYTELYEALKDLGGFVVLFPHLETFTISAYTGDVPRGNPTCWTRRNEALFAMRDAWLDMLDTIGAPVRCNSTSRQYPLHSYQLDRLVINHVYEDPLQAAGRVQYYHAADLDYSNWLFWYNTRVVYLYTPNPDVKAEEPYTMSQMLGKKVLELLHHMLVHKNGYMDSRYRGIDMEVRVNASCFDMRGLEPQEQEWVVERALSRINKLVVDWYCRHRWESRLAKDRFVLRVMSERLVCPACEPPAIDAQEHGLNVKVDLLAPLEDTEQGQGDSAWRKWYFGLNSYYIDWGSYRPDDPASY